MANTKSLVRVKDPQSLGVNTKVVNEFLKTAQEKNLEFHSLMVVRNGKVAIEWYNEPFSRDSSHVVYSVSKSFTSTAIGFAIDEGLLTLDTKLLDVFPEVVPKKQHEYFEKLTVRNLLRMSGGKQPSIIADKSKIDWLDDFVNSPWAFEPGEKFLYINENFYVLSAMINRLTGVTLRQYLMPRLFEPLGIDFPEWETDRNGIEAGGWGLYLKTEDLAKFVLCYLNEGKYKNKQIIPKSWTLEATAKQIDNSYNRPGTEASVGYGYGFWKNKFSEKSFRADGMFCQFGITFSEHNAVVVVTSSIPVEEDGLVQIFNYFPKAFEDISEEKESLAPAYLEKPVINERSATEQLVDNRFIKFKKKILLNLVGFPLSVLPIAVTYMLSEKTGNIDMVKFRFDDKDCTFQWSEGEAVNTIPVGLDGHYRYGKMHLAGLDFTVCSNATWIDENNLLLSIRPIETVGKRNLIFDFLPNDKVIMTPSSTPSCASILDSLNGFFDQIIPFKPVCNVFKNVLTYIPSVVECKHYGKFIDKIK